MFVETARIKSDVPRSDFSEAELTHFAERLIKLEGTIRPPVVRETGMHTREYEVVHGHFECYVAVRAMELDKERGDMTSVFLITPTDDDPEREVAVLELVKSFTEREVAPLQQNTSIATENTSIAEREVAPQPAENTPIVAENVSIDMMILSKKIEGLENILNQKTESLENVLNHKLDQQDTQIQKILECLQQWKEKPTPLRTAILDEDRRAFLDVLNSGEKSDLIRIKGIKEKTAQKIIDHRPYHSMGDVHNVKRFTHKMAEKWLREWQEVKKRDERTY